MLAIVIFLFRNMRNYKCYSSLMINFKEQTLWVVFTDFNETTLMLEQLKARFSKRKIKMISDSAIEVK